MNRDKIFRIIQALEPGNPEEAELVRTLASESEAWQAECAIMKKMVQGVRNRVFLERAQFDAMKKLFLDIREAFERIAEENRVLREGVTEL